MKSLLLALLFAASGWASTNSDIVQGCADLKKIGDFNKFKNEIAADMAEINRLIKTQSPQKIDQRVSELAERISNDTDLMAKLVDSRYTDVTHTQDVHYAIGLKQVDDGPTLNPIESIRAARVVELYNFSSRSKEPLGRVRVVHDAHNVYVHLVRPASLLEICELPQTLLISIDLQVQALFSIELRTYNLFTRNHS